MMKLFVFIFLVGWTGADLTSKNERFTEELLLKPLYGDQLYAHFQFTTKWDVDPEFDNILHTNLFPRALSEIITRHNIHELHIALTAGLWRYETWGYPIYDAAPGAEVSAWFRPNTEDVDKNWTELASSLSGLLCASFNFVNSATSINPEITFRPLSVFKDQKVNASLFRYATLPKEIVCTENLTPWKKLLPCDAKIGVAELLNAGFIHNTRYHSIGIHMREVCRSEDCLEVALELQQTVDLVYDYKLLGSRDWSFRKLFGQGIMGTCPLADASNIYVDVSSNATFPFVLNPQPDEVVTSIRGGQESTFAKYEVKPYAMSIYATYSGNPGVVVNSPPPIYATFYKVGYGQQKGGLVTKIHNNYWTELDVIVLMNIPWYVPIYLHTLKVKSGDVELQPKYLKFKPGFPREKPYSLELVLTVPSRSTTEVSINFDYIFLRWQEYPPDANHGFYIGSTVVATALPLARNFTGFPQDGGTIAESFNASRSSYVVLVRTESIVVTLPTPDFSMPYNVICLACTVVALAFGPLHNITTKRLVLKVKSAEAPLKRLVSKAKEVFFGKKDVAASEKTIKTD